MSNELFKHFVKTIKEQLKDLRSSNFEEHEEIRANVAKEIHDIKETFSYISSTLEAHDNLLKEKYPEAFKTEEVQAVGEKGDTSKPIVRKIPVGKKPKKPKEPKGAGESKASKITNAVFRTKRGLITLLIGSVLLGAVGALTYYGIQFRNTTIVGESAQFTLYDLGSQQYITNTTDLYWDTEPSENSTKNFLVKNVGNVDIQMSVTFDKNETTMTDWLMYWTMNTTLNQLTPDETGELKIKVYVPTNATFLEQFSWDIGVSSTYVGE